MSRRSQNCGIATGVLQGLAIQEATVTVPGESTLIGRTAVEILIDEAADSALPARQIVFQPELVVRASSGG